MQCKQCGIGLWISPNDGTFCSDGCREDYTTLPTMGPTIIHALRARGFKNAPSFGYGHDGVGYISGWCFKNNSGERLYFSHSGTLAQVLAEIQSGKLALSRGGGFGGLVHYDLNTTSDKESE